MSASQPNPTPKKSCHGCHTPIWCSNNTCTDEIKRNMSNGVHDKISGEKSKARKLEIICNMINEYGDECCAYSIGGDSNKEIVFQELRRTISGLLMPPGQPDPTPQDVAAPTLEQRVKSVLDSMDIERKTFTSLTYPPLACSYGLSDPGDILEFARRLLAHE